MHTVPVDDLADSPHATGTAPDKDESKHQFIASDRHVEIIEEIKEDKQQLTKLPAQETKSLKSTQEGESSDIELPEMFENDNWWLEAERPMTDECLTAFLKKHL